MQYAVARATRLKTIRRNKPDIILSSTINECNHANILREDVAPVSIGVGKQKRRWKNEGNYCGNDMRYSNYHGLGSGSDIGCCRT
jgi:hypothetical protein